VRAELRALGFRGACYIGGSFVTDKPDTGDLDVVVDVGTSPGWYTLVMHVADHLERFRALGVDVWPWREGMPDMRRLWRCGGPVIVLAE